MEKYSNINKFSCDKNYVYQCNQGFYGFAYCLQANSK